MRIVIGVVGLVLVLLESIAASTVSARAQGWCGVHVHEMVSSRVQCGYSNFGECKRTLGDKDAICIPDPFFASNRAAQVRISCTRGCLVAPGCATEKSPGLSARALVVKHTICFVIKAV